MFREPGVLHLVFLFVKYDNSSNSVSHLVKLLLGLKEIMFMKSLAQSLCRAQWQMFLISGKINGILKCFARSLVEVFP